MLAVRDDGHVVGSVSGGCIEDDLIERVRSEGLKATKCEVVTYGVSADEARRFGLPCGGTIQLVLEPLTKESGILALLREIEDGHLVARRLELSTGFSTLHPANPSDGLAFDGKTLTTDGPFVAVKEALGGYLFFEADDLDAAIELASRIPAARMGGAVEVRPLKEQ